MGKRRSRFSAEFQNIKGPQHIGRIKTSGIAPTFGNKCFPGQMEYMRDFIIREIAEGDISILVRMADDLESQMLQSRNEMTGYKSMGARYENAFMHVTKSGPCVV